MRKGIVQAYFISVCSWFYYVLPLIFMFVLMTCACVDRVAYTSTPITKEQANQLVPSIANFINNCAAEQIRLAPDKCIHLCFTLCCYWCALKSSDNHSCLAVVSVCKRLKDQVMLLETPMRGVAPLLTAIRKLQPASELLTALHPELLLLCLLAKCYKTGLRILEDDIFEVDQPRDFFLYCYYG